MTPRTTEPAVLAVSNEPLHTRYDAVLVDLDGVVYRGAAAVPGAAATIEAARAAGLRVVFVTNNASREPAAVAEHLDGLDIPAAAEDIVTSAQAAARLLSERLPPGATVLVVGGPGLRRAVLDAGFEIVATAADAPAAVVQGYTPETTYAELAEAVLAVRAGALWVASNTDATIPTERGLLPGNGALVALVATATGARPEVAGKPEGPLFAVAAELAGAQRPLVIGDRLDTDIAGARRAGFDSLLVLSGASTAEDLLAAPPEWRPTYVASDLTGLVRAHPAAPSDEHDQLRSSCRAAWG